MPWASTSTAPQLGNLGKNTMTGPGTQNMDITLSRKLKFTERVNGAIRMESYNTLNHTQFSGLDTTLRFDPTGAMYNTAFNTATSARPSRRVQIAVRVQF